MIEYKVSISFCVSYFDSFFISFFFCLLVWNLEFSLVSMFKKYVVKIFKILQYLTNIYVLKIFEKVKIINPSRIQTRDSVGYHPTHCSTMLCEIFRKETTCIHKGFFFFAFYSFKYFFGTVYLYCKIIQLFKPNFYLK